MWKFTFVVFILLPPTSCFPLDVNSLNVNQFFLCTIFVCNNLKFPSYLADSFVLYYSTLCLLALLLCTTFPNLIYWCWTVPFFHWLFDERWKRYREWNMFCLISNWVRFHQIEMFRDLQQQWQRGILHNVVTFSQTIHTRVRDTLKSQEDTSICIPLDNLDFVPLRKFQTKKEKTLVGICNG